jgi:hypothetical protein
MRCFMFTTFEVQRCIVHRHTDRVGPIRRHRFVLVVVTFELKFEIRPAHQGLVNLRFKEESVVADSQVVL